MITSTSTTGDVSTPLIWQSYGILLCLDPSQRHAMRIWPNDRREHADESGRPNTVHGRPGLYFFTCSHALSTWALQETSSWAPADVWAALSSSMAFLFLSGSCSLSTTASTA